MRKLIAVAVLATAFVTGMALPAHAPQETRLLPCPTEDSVNCYWDAQIMGNSYGRSFIVDAYGNRTYSN